ncbi:MAG: tol-pal system protein YbgF [Nitrospinae bacterium]|nr:tol-pal system protein YbgF [Nitrospinota bacterium]
MFKFSLEALHKVRKREEEERQKDLAHATNAQKKEVDTLNEYKKDFENKIIDLQGKYKTSYDNKTAILYDWFFSGKKHDMQQKKELIEKIDTVVQEKRQSVLKAYIKRKVIDNFKERKHMQYIEEEKKNEEKELDEIVTMSFKKMKEKSHFLVLLISFSLFIFPGCGNGTNEVKKVEAMNKRYEIEKKDEGPKEDETIKRLKEALSSQEIQNRQLLIEMANLKEKMVELEKMPRTREEIIINTGNDVSKEFKISKNTIKTKAPEKSEVMEKPVKSTVSYQPKVLYKMGYNAVTDGDYKKARELFEQFLHDYPKHSFADNCLYWTGETYYAEKDYKTALHYFNRLAQEYPAGNKVPDALMKSGYSYYFLGRKEMAGKVFETFIENYPESSLRSKVDEMVQKLKETSQ